MRIIRFLDHDNSPTLGVITDDDLVFTLPCKGFMELVQEAENRGVSTVEVIRGHITLSESYTDKPEKLRLLAPIEAPEVWAAGVTYERSRNARNYESTGGKQDAPTFYDKVYDAERPEIFFKSSAVRTVGPNQEVFLRSDSSWQIPEAELGLVVNKDGEILGYTGGNDMSCRDIEGENPLYLPQAKIWKHSCAIGPTIRLAETVENPYNLEITLRIYRNNEKLVEGTANTGQLKRKYEELVAYLCRDNTVFDGTVLLTGTCIVPPDDFTLEHNDRIEIDITGIGTLTNYAKNPQVIKAVSS